MPSSQMPSAIGSSTRHSRSTLPARAIGVSKPENLLPGKKTRNDCDLRLRRCPTQGGTELRKSPGPQTGNCARERLMAFTQLTWVPRFDGCHEPRLSWRGRGNPTSRMQVQPTFEKGE